MSESLLDQLKALTIVVADTADLASIEAYEPRDATTNPSLLATAAGVEGNSAVVDASLAWAKKESRADAKKEDVARLAIDHMSVAFGLRVLEIIPGRVSTEVDARLSYDTAKLVEKAHWLIALFEKSGVERERVLVKLASTWEGIEAARELEKEGIHCNMTLLFGMHQAVACAEAKVTLVSPFVGRILDWYKKSTGRDAYEPAEDPGVRSVTAIYEYFKKYGYETQVMGASFRNLEEITELAGCDLLTISPKLLKELDRKTGDLPRKLSPEKAAAMDIPRLDMNREVFAAMHAQDPMANETLAAGIEGFTKAVVDLEKTLVARL